MKLEYHVDPDEDGIETIQSGINFRFGEAKQMCQQVCQHHRSNSTCSKSNIEHAQEQQQNTICIVLGKKDLAITVDDAVQM
mgnify:CR=1 FL=1